MNDIRQRLIDEAGGDEEIIFFDPPETFDPAVIGIARRIGQPPIVAYDREKVLANLAADMQDSEDPMQDAIEWFEYNTIGSYVGEYTPIFITLVGP